MKILISFLSLFILSANLFADDKDIPVYLEMAARGQMDEVRKVLPDMLAKNPNDPGVQLLHASILQDAETAMKMYEKIVDEHPQSKWADDAHWRIIQYYSVLGDVYRAQSELKKFKDKYPVSEFLVSAFELVRICETIHGNSYFDKSKAQPGAKKELKPAKRQEAPEVEDEDLADKEPKPKAEEKFAKAEEKASAKPVVKEMPKPIEELKNKKISYGWQVSSFKNRESAQKSVEEMLQRRLRTEIIEKTFKGVLYYAVVVGNYPTKQRAEDAKETIVKQCGCQPILTEK